MSAIQRADASLVSRPILAALAVAAALAVVLTLPGEASACTPSGYEPTPRHLGVLESRLEISELRGYGTCCNASASCVTERIRFEMTELGAVVIDLGPLSPTEHRWLLPLSELRVSSVDSTVMERSSSIDRSGHLTIRRTLGAGHHQISFLAPRQDQPYRLTVARMGLCRAENQNIGVIRNQVERKLVGLDRSECSVEINDALWRLNSFVFELSERRLSRISVAGDNGTDPSLRLFEVSDDGVESPILATRFTTSRYDDGTHIWRTLDEGRYRLEVESPNTAEYQLSISAAQCAENRWTTVDGSIDRSGQLFGDSCVANLFELADSTAVRVNLTSSGDAQTYLRLLDADGEQIASNWTNKQDGTALIDQWLKRGAYSIEVAKAGSGPVRYRMTASTLTAVCHDEDLGLVAESIQRSGHLNPGGCLRRNTDNTDNTRGWSDVYELELEGRQIVQIDLTAYGNEFSLHLSRLVDHSWGNWYKTIALGDDHKRDDGARIRGVIVSGEYKISVIRWGGQTGDATEQYELSITVTGANPGGYSAWLGSGQTTASELLNSVREIDSIWLRQADGWLSYGVAANDQVIPGSTDFTINPGAILWLSP